MHAPLSEAFLMSLVDEVGYRVELISHLGLLSPQINSIHEDNQFFGLSERKMLEMLVQCKNKYQTEIEFFEVVDGCLGELDLWEAQEWYRNTAAEWCAQYTDDGPEFAEHLKSYLEKVRDVVASTDDDDGDSVVSNSSNSSKTRNIRATGQDNPPIKEMSDSKKSSTIEEDVKAIAASPASVLAETSPTTAETSATTAATVTAAAATTTTTTSATAAEAPTHNTGKDKPSESQRSGSRSSVESAEPTTMTAAAEIARRKAAQNTEFGDNRVSDNGRRDSRQSDSKQPDSRQSDNGGPDSRQPDSKRPDSRQSDNGRPNSRQSDNGRPNSRQSDNGRPNSRQSDNGRPNSRQSGNGRPDSRQSDSKRPDSRESASKRRDSRQSDNGQADIKRADSIQSDCRESDNIGTPTAEALPLPPSPQIVTY